MSVLLVLLDTIAVALTILLGAIVKADGFILHIADLRIRLRTPWRTLFWLAAVVIVRLILDRRSLPFAPLLRKSDARVFRWPRHIELGLVVGLFCVPLFLGLKAWDMQNDEAIYSYAVDRAVEADAWLTPRSIPGDNPFLEKPPLKFWLVGGAIKAGLLPHDEFGLRFFDALFGAVAFVYVFRLGRALAGPGCGFVACLMLFTLDALLFDHGLRSNNMDAALVLAYCGGIYHFTRWADGDSGRRQRAHALAVGAYFALGFMMKFVAVFFLPLICGLALVWRRDGLRRISNEWRHWIVPALLVLLVIAPWFVYQTAVGGSAVWREMFGVHVYERFTAALDSGHLQPWHFYYVWTWNELVFAGTQWLSAAGLVMLAIKAWGGRPWLARLVCIWGLVPYALLALTTSKLFHYAYPFLPPLALGAGCVVVAVFRAIDRWLATTNPKVIRRTAALAVVALMLPVSTYVLQAKHLFTPGAPLRTLRDCAASVSGLHETRVYVPYWDRLGNHAFFYYLRRIGPWVQTDQLDTDDLQRRLFDPTHQSLVVMTREDYDALALTSRIYGVGFPEAVVILTPGPFAKCGEAAVAAGGTPLRQAVPPRGRHWH